MQHDANQKTGRIGQIQVTLAFTKIGWGEPKEIPQDIGDDLFTFARDQNGEDLGFPVIMQVKSSQDKYSEASTDTATPGWWYYESDTRHFDHWVRFGIPCLLVLHDIPSEVTYWAHVSGDAIVSTGKGRKIFVPKQQKVDVDNLDALIDVSASQRVNELEGSVWHGHKVKTPPSALLRTALIAPRVIAPNPNRRSDDVCFEEAVAMLLRGRRQELGRLADKDIIPRLDRMHAERDWGWRFAGALDALLSKEDASSFGALDSSARHTFERVACRVVRACAAYQKQDFTTATSALKIPDDAEAVDASWMHGQLAHLHLEREENEQATAHAVQALDKLSFRYGDPTAAAIRGGCTATLFALTPFDQEDIAGLLQAQDNAVAWWRALQLSQELRTDLKTRFDHWTEAAPVTAWSPSSPGPLLSLARWNAALAGDWGGWRDCSRLLALQFLTTDPDERTAETAIHLLRITGHKKEIGRASRRIWRGGPVTPLKKVVTELTQQSWTRRAEGANLQLYSEAGDLLTAEDAAAAVAQTIALVEQLGENRAFAGSWAKRWPEVGRALRRLLMAAPSESHEQVARFVVARLPDENELAAEELVATATQLNISELRPDLRDGLFEVACVRSDNIRLEVLEVLALHHVPAAERIRQMADSGDANAALSALVTDQAGADDWDALATSAQGQVQHALEKAARRSYGFGGRDSLRDLVLASMHTGNTEHWTTIVEAISAGTMSLDHIQDTVWFLAHRFEELPDFVQDRIRHLSPDLRAAPTFSGSTDTKCLRFALEVVSGNLNTEAQVIARYQELRQQGHGKDLCHALALWRNDRAVALLIALGVDASAAVRATACYALVSRFVRDPDNVSLIAAAVSTAVENDQGCLLPLRVGFALAEHPDVQLLSAVRDRLEDHPSAWVRAVVADPRGDGTTDETGGKLDGNN
ncbi:hypothetical protein F4561_001455 [Lipingzhangella halophila]|uniref:DUF4365 domain-containing protein n=1 Tax=Lipingzhangella halophila TaxID=1783352 RepID=A0A7W7RF14_9ACTN|nr:DUF4365 domain-containing protein [Lipingzhangella halophila]MBB4930635.1 hypothetical protein [Lipingzhangella halophila]